MKGQEINRYLQYLGAEEQQFQNRRRASFVSPKNSARYIVVLMGVLVLLVLLALGYHTATGVGGEQNDSHTQGALAGDQSPVPSDAYADHIAHCPICHAAILFNRLEYCLAVALSAVSADVS